MTTPTVLAQPARSEASAEDNALIGRSDPEGRNRIVDEIAMEQAEEGRDADDALAPFIGLANGLLVSLVLWAFVGAWVFAAYHFAPSWVATTLNDVLLAGGSR
jgi:hypothetical protein